MQQQARLRPRDPPVPSYCRPMRDRVISGRWATLIGQIIYLRNELSAVPTAAALKQDSRSVQTGTPDRQAERP
jgi:hypothetical protein